MGRVTSHVEYGKTGPAGGAVYTRTKSGDTILNFPAASDHPFRAIANPYSR